MQLSISPNQGAIPLPNHRRHKFPSLRFQRRLELIFALIAWAGSIATAPTANLSVFNVRDYGATGKKADDARPAIQKAIDMCAESGGGTVYLPPGEYTSGTLHLRSNIRFEIEAGATLFASPDPGAYDFGKVPAKAAVLFGEDIENVSIEGWGTVDGQADYEWREDDFETGYNHKVWMQEVGKPLIRSFPKGFPKREVWPHLVYLARAKDVRVTGVRWLNSPSWSVTLYACERALFEGLYIYTSLRDAVWADGIDLDGCKDVSISNCTITTGDDCIALSSNDPFGPPLACENINISNCRLSSASAGIKFAEGNHVGMRRVVVSNTVFSEVNRGIVFLNAWGGHITDVLLSDLTINCVRRDWFWAGDGQPFFFRLAPIQELDQRPPKPTDPPVGTIQNISFRNIIAHAKGSSLIHGHAESWLDHISFENVRVFMATDPSAPYDKAQHAIDFRQVKNLDVHRLEVIWGTPSLPTWGSALNFQNVENLTLERFVGRAAWPEKNIPTLMMTNVTEADIRNSKALENTDVFLEVRGPTSSGIRLHGNDLKNAKTPWEVDENAPKHLVVVD